MNRVFTMFLSLFVAGIAIYIGLSAEIRIPQESQANLWSEKSNSIPTPKNLDSLDGGGKGIFVKLAKELNPTVVNIYTTKTIKSPSMFGGEGGEREDLFRRFFEDFFGGPMGPGGPGGQAPKEYKTSSLGSGFIISKDGYIVTNNHVVAQMDEIKVKLTEKTDKEYTAKVIGKDSKVDVALIKITPDSELTAASLGDSDKLEVGEWVMAIGNPFGHGHSVTKGIISAKERSILNSVYSDYLQTDASINPGNSGGPLINTNGEVIGINTAIDARAQGIGFALPINIAKKYLPQLKDKGKVTRGWIGVGIMPLTEDMVKHLKLKSTKGVAITKVFEGDPADKAGLKSYDVIVEFNGKKIESDKDLINSVADVPVGKTTAITVIREGKSKTVNIQVTERKDEDVVASLPEDKKDNLGMVLKTLTPDLASRYGVRSGVVIFEINPNSVAGKANLQEKDIIIEIDRTPVENVESFKKKVSKGDSHMLKVVRPMGEDTGTFIVILKTK